VPLQSVILSVADGTNSLLIYLNLFYLKITPQQFPL